MEQLDLSIVNRFFITRHGRARCAIVKPQRSIWQGTQERYRTISFCFGQTSHCCHQLQCRTRDPSGTLLLVTFTWSFSGERTRVHVAKDLSAKSQRIEDFGCFWFFQRCFVLLPFSVEVNPLTKLSTYHPAGSFSAKSWSWPRCRGRRLPTSTCIRVLLTVRNVEQNPYRDRIFTICSCPKIWIQETLWHAFALLPMQPQFQLVGRKKDRFWVIWISK